jgi:hypothetical protein
LNLVPLAATVDRTAREVDEAYKPAEQWVIVK